MSQVKIHSITSLITNSSTTIYTNSDASVEACKLMVGEILKVFGSDKTCDELFEINSEPDIECEELADRMSSYAPNSMPKMTYGERARYVDSVLSGDIEKPEWFKAMERKIGSNDNRGSTLSIVPRDPKYTELAEKIHAFLYSTNAFEGES